MTQTIERIPVDALDADTIDLTHSERDWSEGYPERWDFAEAPDCFECGGYCRWRSGSDLAEDFRDEEGEFATDVAEVCEQIEDERHQVWRCINPECEQFGVERDPLGDGSAEGPMMNYSYPLPSTEHRDMHDLADLIYDLPLCVIDEGGDGGYFEGRTYSLALTGGGMDLTWEIAEAYTRLGYLPPVEYCRPPAMCGRGSLSNAGEYGAPVSERDQYVIDACRRSLTLNLERTEARARLGLQDLDRLEGKD